MTPRLLLVTLTASLTLMGCSQTTPTPSATAKSALLTLQDQAPAQTFVLRGEVILGHEVRSIQPCGSKQQYWLNLPEGEFERAQPLIDEAYQALYGEVIGYLAPPPQDGFAADYDAIFVVTQINRLSREASHACQQPTRPTRAFGNEPFWSAALSAQHIEFSQPGSPSQAWPRHEQALSPSVREYRSKQATLRLANQHCSDTMSGDIFSWQATLSTSNQNYQGCASLSNYDTSQSWVDSYQASSTQSQNFQVTVELNPDHSATTRYQYLDGSPSRIETGFWQQLNPRQVKVTMTHHQQQYLLAERIFVRDEQGISTQEERINGRIYPLHGGGLKLFNSATSRQALPPQGNEP